MGSTCIKRQMHAQQSGSCGMQDFKKNIVFIAAVLVSVTKYIYGQHLYKEADACTAKWKLWRVGL